MRDSKVTGRRAAFRQVGVCRSAPAPARAPCARSALQGQLPGGDVPALLTCWPHTRANTQSPCTTSGLGRRALAPRGPPIVQRWLSSAGTTHEGDGSPTVNLPELPAGASDCRWGWVGPRT